MPAKLAKLFGSRTVGHVPAPIARHSARMDAEPDMAECTVCRTETFVYVGSIAICIACLENPAIARPRTEHEIRAVLVKKIIDATVRASAASEVFNAITSQIPSGLPHSDGVQRMKSAASDLSSARKELMIAHRRLNEFVESGIMPKDQGQSGG
jgi:hypothetical protein